MQPFVYAGYRVHRRTGGLETAEKPIQIIERVHRRTGGLEKALIV